MTPKNLRQKTNLLIGFLVLFYTGGLLLFMVEPLRSLFVILTPFSLILSCGAVLAFQKEWSGKLIIAFVIVLFSALVIEIIGVRTGVLFGEYVYGRTLGIKISETPILIGLNWLLLIYCTASIVNYHFKNRNIRIILGSVLMVVYDLILEYIAPVTDMWSWEARYPGIRNFLMWFLVALVFHALFQILDLKIENKPAGYLFLIQFLFFCGIGLYSVLTVQV
ncbi:MAG: carotenoid biosynthesis protein [Bacteroidales bacterium]|nr:MAG: carotenoid biosynthesis protein [Bacteroidales bacterium]